MRLPAYLLLPIGGAVVLVAAMLGAWLWPEPTVSVPSGPPPAVMAPATAEAPPPPSSPMPRELPGRAVQPVQPPPSPVAMPMAPPPSPVAMPTAPPPSPMARPPEMAPIPPPMPVVPLNSQLTIMTQEQQAAMRNTFRTMSQRAVELAERSAQELTRQQEEARARGDVAEVNRLEAILSSHRERMERMRQQRLELTPEAQAGPPLE